MLRRAESGEVITITAGATYACGGSRALPGRDHRPDCLVRARLDTSVLTSDTAPEGVEAAVGAASIAELHFGVQITADPDEWAVRTRRLGATEATFGPLPITAEVAREWGRLAAAVSTRGAMGPRF